MGKSRVNSQTTATPGGSMNHRRGTAFLLLIAVMAIAIFFVFLKKLLAQEQDTSRQQKTLTIEEYEPKSTLLVPEHKLDRAKFPFIDIHSHHWNPTPEEVDRLVKEMDTINLHVMVNLNCGTGGRLKRTVAMIDKTHSKRFVLFRNI